MRGGTIRTRAGGPYRSTTIEQAERSLRLHVLPELAHVRVDRLEARELRAFADRMLAAGKDPGTVISAMQPEPGLVKTDAGRRSVPIIAALRDQLLEHRMRIGEPAPDAYVFGAATTRHTGHDPPVSRSSMESR